MRALLAGFLLLGLLLAGTGTAFAVGTDTASPSATPTDTSSASSGVSDTSTAPTATDATSPASPLDSTSPSASTTAGDLPMTAGDQSGWYFVIVVGLGLLLTVTVYDVVRRGGE